jgi:glutamyl-Q tRNA(Asp) synthetase
VAACASFLQARAQRGEWLVRMEDLDPPREQRGAADAILRTLEAHGLHWDGMVRYQSRRADAYHAALEELRRMGALYACGCSRREIADSSIRGIDGPVYPGTCRPGLAPGRAERGLRVRAGDGVVSFVDRWQGSVTRHPARDYGDFLVRRADGLFAYQLAVVVDDAEQGITEVVRGADLLESTPRQIELQRLLGLPTPDHAHCPVAVNARGEKLSKQTGAVPLDNTHPLPALAKALDFLGQEVPADARAGSVEEFWRRAVARWSPDAVPRRTAIAAASESPR